MGQVKINYMWMILPVIGFGIGWYLDNKETHRMTLFRDKSALYGKPPDALCEPSWP